MYRCNGKINYTVASEKSNKEITDDESPSDKLGEVLCIYFILLVYRCDVNIDYTAVPANSEKKHNETTDDGDEISVTDKLGEVMKELLANNKTIRPKILFTPNNTLTRRIIKRVCLVFKCMHLVSKHMCLALKHVHFISLCTYVVHMFISIWYDTGQPDVGSSGHNTCGNRTADQLLQIS